MWPQNIVGWISNRNDIPTRFAGGTAGAYLVHPIERGANYVVFESTEAHDYADLSDSDDFYLGFVKDLSTQEILWINDTRPLP